MIYKIKSQMGVIWISKLIEPNDFNNRLFSCWANYLYP
jgi:hypothetical protein